MIRILSLLAVAFAAVPAEASVPKGAVAGTVIFEGEAPTRDEIVRDSDPYCEKVKKLTEDVIVTKGKLKDVLVRVKSGPTGTFTPPTGPVLLDQKDCMYTPRVVGVLVGQKLAVRNSDGTFHNVRGTVAGKQLWNNAQPKQAADLSLDAGPKAGDVVEVQCDVHPWMHAYAVVQENPFFAVTSDDGKFTISGLPEGSYVLEAWHPQLGKKELKVKIGKGKKAAVTARFSYKATE